MVDTDESQQKIIPETTNLPENEKPNETFTLDKVVCRDTGNNGEDTLTNMVEQELITMPQPKIVQPCVNSSCATTIEPIVKVKAVKKHKRRKTMFDSKSFRKRRKN